jgi:methionyl aminopeptidase
MIPLKSEADLKMLRKSGEILSRIMRELRRCVKIGVSTQEIDNLAEELMRRENVRSAFKGYRQFPAHICTSVNEEIVHGIPSARRLQDGDILSLDIGINYQGYFSDAAVTLALGDISPRARKLIRVTREALCAGIKKARVNNHLFDISFAIQSYVERQGFSVVREFVGHGIGLGLHEEPEIPNFGRRGEGALLRRGMVLAIEPMVNMGVWQSRISPNGWTAVTEDGLPSAHFEHTVAISDKGPQILTQ